MNICEHGKGLLRWSLRCFGRNKIENFLSPGLRINLHNENIVFRVIVVTAE